MSASPDSSPGSPPPAASFSTSPPTPAPALLPPPPLVAPLPPPPPPPATTPPPAAAPPRLPDQSASPPPPPLPPGTPPLTPPSPPSPPATPSNPTLQPPPSAHDSGSVPPPPGAKPPLIRPPPGGSSHSHPAPKAITGSSLGAHGSGSGGGGNLPSTAWIGVAVGGAAVVAIVVLLLVCLLRRNKRTYRTDYEYGNSPAGRHESERKPRHDADRHEAERKPRHDSPHSSSEAQGIFYPPPPPPPRHNNYGPQQLQLFNTPYDSGSATDVPSPRQFAPPPPPPRGSSSLGNSRNWFTLEELEAATEGFSRSNLLGQGGFGDVFKGVLPGGKQVAVKRLKVGGRQGEREFRAEVETISRVHHRHLVSLVGYCIAESQHLLVYDYVPNGTLEFHLHEKGRPAIDWTTRLKVAIGAARGLAYLHEDCHPRIIHRDIKSSNILLDYQFEAKVSDFGLAKFASDTHSHVTTRVMGTFGYLAPEYASSGKLTEKSDVFSFGVVLLELVTGQKPVDSSRPLGSESLFEWARPLLNQTIDGQTINGLVDPRLGGSYNVEEMRRMIGIAAACIRRHANERPRMGQVVRVLEDDGADLHASLKPGHGSNFASPHGSVNSSTTKYPSDFTKLSKLAFGTSQDHSTYSGATSEYGLNPSVSSSEFQSSKEIDRRP